MNAKMEISTALEDKTTSATWEDLGESKRNQVTKMEIFSSQL